jgi:hypothetical protein
MSWNDPSGSGFHSQSEKTANRGLRDQIDTLHQNYEGSHGWNEASAAVAGSSTGKYDDKLMNDDHLNKMISWLSERQKTPEAPAPVEKVDTNKPASQKLNKAQSYAQAYKDSRQSGSAVNQMAGDLGARDEFLSNYKLNLQRRMQPDQKAGNDDLPAIQ